MRQVPAPAGNDRAHSLQVMPPSAAWARSAERHGKSVVGHESEQHLPRNSPGRLAYGGILAALDMASTVSAEKDGRLNATGSWRQRDR